MAYLYRHIRLDNNEPFYIGIGSDSEGKYKRANNSRRRSFSWKDIALHIPYRVDIIMDDLTWDEACSKEKEFISMYGRKDLDKGNLVNFTDGGEGNWGRKDSEATRLKKCGPKSELSRLHLKLSHIGRDYSYMKGKVGCKKGIKKSPEHASKLRKVVENKKIKIYCIELNTEYESMSAASKIFNVSPGDISNIVNGSGRRKKLNGIKLTFIKI